MASKTTAARTTTGRHHHPPRRRSVPSGPPVVIAQHECPSAMRAHVLEVPPGRDVLSCVSAFARRGRRGALVLGAAGSVADVVLRDPAALVLRGTMEILGLAGCFFPFPSPGSAGTAVFLAGPRGTVLGGAVAPGGLVAAGPVVVVVATFVAAALDQARHPLPQSPRVLLRATSGAPPPSSRSPSGRLPHKQRNAMADGQAAHEHLRPVIPIEQGNARDKQRSFHQICPLAAMDGLRGLRPPPSAMEGTGSATVGNSSP
ncbi:AT-hook motif nuclear-localized protein 23-like [Panicum virgatum]|uniref:AT-hook motif nuclear-localized protein 23-like n=1 Tax=Panicum virgatum TaxID=38727 RepID=UPI0019D6A939|nr:AT-hook motif nuclear-localized protein 23-like [Panicum virgatum]